MTTYRITVDVTVLNEDRLLNYADQRIQACWKTSLDDMLVDGEEKVERALIEVLLYSNENPSPDDYGIDIGGRIEIRELT